MKGNDFLDFLSHLGEQSSPVISDFIANKIYIPINLSSSNKVLNKVDVSSSAKLGNFINAHIKSKKAQIAYGGYLEVRNIYKRSDYFNSQAEDERNIHLGIDLWVNAETPIYTPLEGTVHSFKNNTNHGDYGPTIILRHIISGVEFYSLYGHLSLKSIQNLEVGQAFKRGEKIATLGDASINGDYPPHLHFQIIKDMQNYIGDYPGVCSANQLDFYSLNCPNPNLLLKLKN